MLKVKEYLAAAGLEVPSDKIKLIKHVDSVEYPYKIRDIIDTKAFDFFQAEQNFVNKNSRKGPFHGVETIVSFIAKPGNFAEFQGVYRVNGVRDFTAEDMKGAPEIIRKDPNRKPKFWYDLEELVEFKALTGRLIVKWNSTQGWHQKIDLPIFELLPHDPEIEFPGYQDVILSWEELKLIIDNPRTHKAYTTALKETAGIYRIIDQSDGSAYIGSASGKDGLLGRWTDYVKNGHGGNRDLKDRDPRNFRWSIIRTLSGSMSPRDVHRIEGIEKEKHGSRVHGLNAN